MIDGSTKSFRVLLFDLGTAKHSFDVSLKGSNSPTMNTVSDCIVFGAQTKSYNCDVTMVIGRFNNSKESLLLNLRFNEEVRITNNLDINFLIMQKTTN